MQLYQDFPKISTTSIRACLKMYNFHYAPTFYCLMDAWNKLQLEDNKGKSVIKSVKISETKSARKIKSPRNPRCLDPDFRREWESVTTKLGNFFFFCISSSLRSIRKCTWYVQWLIHSFSPCFS